MGQTTNIVVVVVRDLDLNAETSFSLSVVIDARFIRRS